MCRQTDLRVWSSDGNLCGADLVDGGTWMWTLSGVDDSDVCTTVELLLSSAAETHRAIHISAPVVTFTSTVIPTTHDFTFMSPSAYQANYNFPLRHEDDENCVFARKSDFLCHVLQINF